jgi:hypothetical protein
VLHYKPGQDQEQLVGERHKWPPEPSAAFVLNMTGVHHKLLSIHHTTDLW